MPGFQINPKLRGRLTEILEEELGRIEVQSNSSLLWKSLDGLERLDNALPEPRQETTRQLHEFVGERPLFNFVYDYLAAGLSGRQFDHDQPVVPITTIEAFADPHEVATNILDSAASLPWRYTIFIALPGPLTEPLLAAMEAPEWKFSDQVSVWTVHEGSDAFPIAPEEEGGLASFLGGRVPAGVERDLLYLKIEALGYVGTFGLTNTLDRAISMAKAIFGLAIANRLFRPPHRYFGPVKRHALIYKYEGATWRFQRAQELGSDEGHTIATVGLDSDRFAAVPDAARPSIIKHDLEKIATAVRHSKEDDKLLRGSEWLLDSFSYDNDLLSFIQATIVLEILLGEGARSDLIGLGELLGNRCAYLIGTTKTQRDDILKNFRRIYDTRSKIVHRGKNRLSRSDLDDLWTLRWMGGRVLQEEIALLQADAKK